jgi:long-chain fatty acid transport protein
MQKPKRTILSSAVLMTLISSVVHAGAFSLYTEGSAVAVGNYAAGAAAEGSDASIGWYNPAGLVLINNQQVVLSGVGVLASTNLSGTSVFTTEPSPPFPPYVQNFTDLQAAKSAVVPALHYARPLGNWAVFGLSVTAPFGLSTEYSNDSPVRYAATLSELKSVDVSPELGGKLTDNFSIGAGLDFQWAQVKFNRMLGSPSQLQFLQSLGAPVTPTFLDSESYNKAHSFGMGFHAGILGMFNANHTRIGLNYQSQVKHRFNGYSRLTGRLADPALLNPNAVFRTDTLFGNPIEMPEVVTLSAYQDITSHWALLGSLVYTGWDCFQEIRLNNVAAYSPELATQVIVSSGARQDYENSWRFALGANYKVNEVWLIRFGGGFDQTPTINAHRDVRLPDADRWALSIGTHYQLFPAIGLDFGYTYLWANDDALVNTTEQLGTTSTYSVSATAKPHAHLVGLQAVWTIDKEVAGK